MSHRAEQLTDVKLLRKNRTESGKAPEFDWMPKPAVPLPSQDSRGGRRATKCEPFASGILADGART